MLQVRRKSDSRGLSIKYDLVRLELVSRETPARAFCLEPDLSAVAGCHRPEAASRPLQDLLRPVQVAVSPSADRLRPAVLATARHRQLVDSTSADGETCCARNSGISARVSNSRSCVDVDIVVISYDCQALRNATSSQGADGGQMRHFRRERVISARDG